MSESRRNTTAVIVLLAVILSILYLWKPWSDQPSIRPGLDLQGGLRIVLQAEGDEAPTPEDMQTARSVIENRINEFGVAEPTVTTSGTNRIVVEIPGITAEEQDVARDLIGQQAILEFRLVKAGAAGASLEDLEEPAFTGEIIGSARADYPQVGGASIGGAAVFFTIKGPYQAQFAEFTGGNLGRSMATVLDGEIMNVATLQGSILDNGQISGMGSLEDASNLALVLRSGSLPVSLEEAYIQAIGPTLGADSVRAGRTAAIIGLSAVAIVILLFYGPLFGGVLTFGLVLVMLFVFGSLAGLGAVLTLPGLAGLVLTIGAAVDGNVISFERIKEELRAGNGLRLSMRKGFEHSLSAIIDANVTTLLAAAALYQYTSGPVRGFAVTLAIGIMAALFVNIIVVPFLLDVLTLRIKKPLFWNPASFTRIHFVKRAKTILAISGAIALLSILLVFVRGLNPSTDFTGGSSILYSVTADTQIDDVRSAITDLGIAGVSEENATIQKVVDDTITGELISVRLGLQGDQSEAATFASNLGEAINADVLQQEFVGPSVGTELRNAAFLAMFVAIGLILIYVAWRFWPNWIIAIGAIIAVIHDVAIVLGVHSVVGSIFSIPVLAALLFVVGYSLNDSIIISDRIRENIKKMRLGYEEIVDISVTQTLTRTIITSGTTLLPVLALLFFGGSVLRGFSITLLVGIGVGTYSSIFILAPLVVWFNTRQQENKKNAPTSKKRRRRRKATA